MIIYITLYYILYLLFILQINYEYKPSKTQITINCTRHPYILIPRAHMQIHVIL